MKKTIKGFMVVALLTLGGVVHATGDALLKSTDDLLAMTDADAILFAAKAAPSPAFLEGARVYRLAPDRRSLRLIKDGPGPWNFVAGIPNDIAPIAVDDQGLKWVRALLAGEKPQLDRPGIGFLWAGNQFVPPGTQELRPLPPGIMVIWPFDPKTTGLSAGREKGLVRIMLADSPYAHVIVPIPGLKGLFGE
jgi:hypothetical protein